MAKIEEKVEQLVKDPIEKLGYSLYDVEYVKEGPEYYLRIYIDKESGIDLNDCEKVSNEINEILDKAVKAGKDTDVAYVEDVLPGKMKYNLEYLKQFSVLHDLKICIDTVIGVLK